MSSESKADRIRKMQRAGLAGDVGTSNETGRRRGQQSALAVEERFDPKEFNVDDEQRVSLRQAKPGSVRSYATNHLGEDSLGIVMPLRNYGPVTGPGAIDNNHADRRTFFQWARPTDLDRSKSSSAQLQWLEYIEYLMRKIWINICIFPRNIFIKAIGNNNFSIWLEDSFHMF